MKKLFTICFYIILILSASRQAYPQQLTIPQELFSRAERTWYQETSVNADVKAFCEAAARLSRYAHTEVFGRTKEGNDLIMVVLSSPKVTTPAEAAKTGKPVIYIQGNIHAGEVEGKEASMQLIREICFGPKTSLIDNQILIFCPNFNPDGNDKLSATSRPSQDGSPALTGVRSSGEGYDLNREGIKAEALETKAFLQNIILKWDPALLIDLHTDNGSWHGYALNYAPAYLTAGSPVVFNFVNEKILPTVRAKMLDRSGIPVFSFGYMNQRQGEQSTFSTYSHLPRYIVNYMGLRNRMAILSETFSHDRFEKRVLSNYLFLVSVLEFTNSNYREISETIRKADEETVRLITEQGGKIKKGVTYKIEAAPEPIPLLTRETEEYTDENGRTRRRPTGRLHWINDVRHYDHFVPSDESVVPSAYVFPAELGKIALKLKEHGITVKTTEKRFTAEAEQFIISKYTRESRAAYGGHYGVKVNGNFLMRKVTIERGSYFVDMKQPLAWLAFYMLEPQSDDGLLFWNYFDDYLLKNGVEKRITPYPVLKIR
ncbi:MAG: M14 family metallopeptidase [Bacteroidales bacterium]|nr:M14 family metallopeptidase [Bacteroidales bacterium]